MESQARTGFLAGEEPDGRSKVRKQLAPPNWRGNCGAQHLGTLSLPTLRGFERVKALGGGLHVTPHMGGKVAPSKEPFDRWISVELTIFALLILHDIPTPFAGIDNGMTGAPVEAAAGLFHKDTVRIRFNRDAFHRFSIPFYA